MIWIRISFFPFFIIDKDAKSFDSVKLSLATTRGNFTKILLLLLVLGGFYFFYLFFSYLQWPIVAFIVNIISSFIVVPLSSVSLTIAYRQMVSDYKGNEHPDILHNIV
jgi:drug/metabolite transporter (DMT)-like permease